MSETNLKEEVKSDKSEMKYKKIKNDYFNFARRADEISEDINNLSLRIKTLHHPGFAYLVGLLIFTVSLLVVILTFQLAKPYIPLHVFPFKVNDIKLDNTSKGVIYLSKAACVLLTGVDPVAVVQFQDGCVLPVDDFSPEERFTLINLPNGNKVKVNNNEVKLFKLNKIDITISAVPQTLPLPISAEHKRLDMME